MPHSQSTSRDLKLVQTITPCVFTWSSVTTDLTAQAITFEPQAITFEPSLSFSVASALTGDSSLSKIVEIRLIKDGITCHDYDGKTAYVGGHPILVQDGIVILFKSRMDPSCNPVIELGDGGEDDTLRQDFSNIGEPVQISILEQRS